MDTNLDGFKLRAKEYVLSPCVTCGKKVMVAFHAPIYVMEEPKIACSETCLKEYDDSIEAWLERNRLT